MLTKLYKPDDVGKSYVPRLAEFEAEGRKAKIRPASADKKTTALIVVDGQGDFVFPGWALPVTGAVDDARRLTDLILGRPEEITSIRASRDKHRKMMIFHAAWWIDENGKHPAPFTVITYAEIVAGKWRALVNPKWSVEYVYKLEQLGKKNLMIWPDHCLENTEGQKLVPAIAEAIAFHSAARGATPLFIDKGTCPFVEHYGIFGAEIPYPKDPATLLNVTVLDAIAANDRILVAGWAEDFCVYETMKQMVGHFGSTQPEVIKKIHFLVDCTSPVGNPQDATKAIEEMANKGVVLVKSTDADL